MAIIRAYESGGEESSYYLSFASATQKSSFVITFTEALLSTSHIWSAVLIPTACNPRQHLPDVRNTRLRSLSLVRDKWQSHFKREERWVLTYASLMVHEKGGWMSQSHSHFYCLLITELADFLSFCNSHI